MLFPKFLKLKFKIFDFCIFFCFHKSHISLQSFEIISHISLQSFEIISHISLQSFHFLSSVKIETIPIDVCKCLLWISLKTTINFPSSSNFFWRNVNDVFGLSDFSFKFG